MAFGSLSGQRAAQPVAEINMIPLIDVMLVLLVIFIVTAPLLTHAVKIDLPKASSQVNVPKRENVHLSIDAAGTVYWNGERVEAGDVLLRVHAATVDSLDAVWPRVATVHRLADQPVTPPPLIQERIGTLEA